MNTLILTIGLPRSGKTTWVKKYIAQHPGAAIVNPDAIRLAITGQRFAIEAEPQVWATARFMVRALFRAGHKTVILDATNTTLSRRMEWLAEHKGFANILYVVFHTDPETCKQRALANGQPDLLPIIDKMYEGWDPPDTEIEDGITWINSSADDPIAVGELP